MDRLSQLPGLPCLCSSLRRTTRALTQLYDEALASVGLRVTQFTILQTLSLAGELSQGQLGTILVMDSTTLTRTLRLMAPQGWVQERRGKDRRERLLRLSKAGLAKLNEALPPWEMLQTRLREQMGQPAWQELMKLSNQATELATNKGD